MPVSPSRSVARRRLMALGDYVMKANRNPAWRKYFNMSGWCGGVPNGRKRIPFDFVPGLKDKPTGSEVIVNNECGTSGCLLGHGVNVPILKHAGLRAIVYYGQPILAIPKMGIYGYSGEDGSFELAAKLFGIDFSRYEQLFLFSGSHGVFEIHKVTPAEAVRNLRKVVKEIDKNEGWEF